MHYRNFWILLIMLLAGIVLGGFMGQLAEGISWLNWLNFGHPWLDSPLVINFGILVITFGLTIKITMAASSAWQWHSSFTGIYNFLTLCLERCVVRREMERIRIKDLPHKDRPMKNV